MLMHRRTLLSSFVAVYLPIVCGSRNATLCSVRTQAHDPYSGPYVVLKNALTVRA